MAQTCSNYMKPLRTLAFLLYVFLKHDVLPVFVFSIKFSGLYYIFSL